MVLDVDTRSAQSDPLGSLADLRYTCRLHPLGFPLELSTNSALVSEAARSSWQDYPNRFENAPVRLHVGVTDDDDPGLPEAPVFRARNHLLTIISDARNFIVLDLTMGFGFGWLSPSALRDEEFLRYYFLDPAMLTMIEQLYLAPVHGALICRTGRGVLLCGGSFTGKSTLAYACARSGWTLVSDDGTFLVRDRADRFGIGNPLRFRLREDAKRFFPELASRLTVVRPNGKLAIEVPTGELSTIETATGVQIEEVVFLNRHHPGCARLVPVSKERGRGLLEPLAPYGTMEVQEARRITRERLLGARLSRLDYADLDAAVANLDDLVRKAV